MRVLRTSVQTNSDKALNLKNIAGVMRSSRLSASCWAVCAIEFLLEEMKMGGGL
jgi:hypothetical protein